jgi:tetratricopeptide (TPR) repeat protein
MLQRSACWQLLAFEPVAGMGYYGLYYVALLLASALAQSPYILLGIVAFVVLRPFLPDPVILWRTMGRISTLKRQIEANPANVTARRDLAVVYLDRLRPGRALELVDEARQRFPDDPELLFLKGVAHSKRGEHEAALDPLVKSVDIDPRLRFGEPYRVAGESLRALGRTAEAVDALERFVSSNGSSIEGHVKLSMALREAGDEERSRAALDEAFRTWRQLPSYQRRQQLGAWLRAWILRVTGL